ncbi:lamin tail domain-containing protein, partial [Ardenticatena maritima]
PTPTPPAVVPLLISEVVYDGTQSGDGDEFVELYNPTDTAIPLAGWGIGDEETRGGSESLYRFDGDFTLAPHGTLVIARDAAAFHARFGVWPDAEMNPVSDTVHVPTLSRDTTWGRGHWALSNSGDEVVLVDPFGRVVDALPFRNADYAAVGRTGHDISAPAPRALHRVVELQGTHLNDILAYDAPSPGEPRHIPPPPASMPPAYAFGPFRAYRGVLHAHTTYSDGSGPPTLAFATGRANGLHFLAISDHSHWFTPEEWARLGTVADAANQPGAFVALRAFEWTSREHGHINVWRTDDFFSREMPGGESVQALYDWLAARPKALAEFNHPFEGHFDDFVLREEVRGQLVLQEIANSAAVLRFAEAYWRALWRGWRVAPVANLDTESANWGRDGDLRAGLLATDLTREALFEAMLARRAFSTEDASLALALRSGETWMGGDIPPGETTLTFYVADEEGEPLTLELWREGAPVWRVGLTPSATPTTRTLTIEAAPGEVLLARAVQADGQEAWSAPLWVQGVWSPPGVLVNEVLPAPRQTDWNEDGVSDGDDEWIELYNPLDRAVGLGGWQLDDEEGGSRPYTFPLGTVIAPHSYLVLFKKTTGVSLNDAGDTARLIAPTGAVVSEIPYAHAANDGSIARDDKGRLHTNWPPSPGAHNRAPETPTTPASPPPPLLSTLADVRHMPLGTRLSVEGVVSVPPHLLGHGIFYVQDAEAGLKIYAPALDLSALHPGDRVRLTGVLRTFHNERELRLESAADIVRLDTGEAPTPLFVQTALHPAHEGRLVQVDGAVLRWYYNRWWLAVSDAEVEIYVRQSTGLRRPWLERGMHQRIVGIAATWDDGMRILPFDATHITTLSSTSASNAARPTVRTAPRYRPRTPRIRFWQRYFAL